MRFDLGLGGAATIRVVSAALVATLMAVGPVSCAVPDTVTPITPRPQPSRTESGSTTCQTEAVAASLGQGPDVVAAGSGTSITLESRSRVSCTMRGFVTLSYLADRSGPTIGAPAEHDESGVFSNRAVTLRPGGSVVVVFSDIQDHTPSCRALPLWGYRVQLPGESSPIEVGLIDQHHGTASGVSICPDSRLVLAPVQNPARL